MLSHTHFLLAYLQVPQRQAKEEKKEKSILKKTTTKREVSLTVRCKLSAVVIPLKALMLMMLSHAHLQALKEREEGDTVTDDVEGEDTHAKKTRVVSLTIRC